MKKLLIIVLIVLFYSLLGASEIYDLPDLMSPHTMTIDKKDIYIAAKSQVFIYEYPDKLKKIFSKKGEGPGEFREYFDERLLVSLEGNNIYVLTFVRKNGANEFYIFDKTGKFIKKLFVKMKDIPLQEVNPLIRISSNKVFQLFEDQDKEIWQLHITEIPAE